MEPDSRPAADPATQPADVAAQERTATEARIFAAALEVFARKGRDGARMQEIADAAAINKAMLHYYFRTKERLYAEVFRHVFERFDRAFRDAVERTGDDRFDAVLERFVDHYISFAGANGDVLRLMVGEFLAGGEVARAQMQRMTATGTAPPQRFVRRIERAIADGEIAAVDPRQLVVTLISGCLFPFIAVPMVTTLIPESTADLPGFLAARKRHLLAVLRNGLQPRSEIS